MRDIEAYVRSIATVLAIAMIAVVTACAGASSDDQGTDSGIDAGVDAMPPDATLPDEARLTLTFDGPPEGSDVRVATNDANVLCFTVKATKPLRIERLQIKIESVGGLYVDGLPQYGDWKLRNDVGDVLTSTIPTSGTSAEISLATTSSISVPAEVDRKICMSGDINNEDLLSGRHLLPSLMAFEAGDVVLTDNDTDLPIDHIDGTSAIHTDLTVFGISGPSVTRSPPQVAPPQNWWGGSLQLVTTPAPPTEIHVHRMEVTAPPEYALLIKQVSYSLRVSFNGQQGVPEETVIGNARLDLYETPTQPSGSWIVQSGGGDCINLAATSRNRCVRVNLNVPLVIPAGETRSLDLYVTVSGNLVHNEVFTTEALQEFFGPQEGPLSRGVIGRGAFNKGAIWGNDGLWWYNGYTVRWGSRYQPTFVIFAPPS